MSKYKIRPMFKKDVAKLYGMSYSTFIRSVEKSRSLKNALYSFGYDDYQKILSIRQIEIIMEHLGIPESLKAD